MLHTMEEEKSNNVDYKSQHPHDHQKFWFMDFLHLDESLARLNGDAEAQGHKEHGVDQGSQDFGSGPAKCVLGPFLRWHLQH